MLLFRQPIASRLILSCSKQTWKSSSLPIIKLSMATYRTSRPTLFKQSALTVWQKAIPPTITPKNPPNVITTPKNTAASSPKIPTISEMKILKDLFKYIWPRGDNKVRIRAVSYTHLDVYKRQTSAYRNWYHNHNIQDVLWETRPKFAYLLPPGRH